MKTYSTPQVRERKQEVACNLCGMASASDFLSGDDFHFVRCLHCGLVYQNPQPLFDDLKHRYGQDYFDYERANEQNFFELMRLGLLDIDFASLGAQLAERSFLDVGCATGMLLAHVRQNGWDVQGVEICRQSAEHGIHARGVPIFTGTLQDAHFPAAVFSVVHFSHLIEHLTSPRAFLLEVRRILSDDGYAIITTPNVDGFQAKLFKSKWRSAIADHLYLFTRRTLRSMLAESGLRVLKEVTWGGIAAGSVPLFVKKPLDVLAKRLHFGDVMLFLTQKA